MWLALVEHLIFLLVVTILISIYVNRGKEEFLRVILLGLKALPGVGGILEKALKNEATNFLKQTALAKKEGVESPRVVLPEKGGLFMMFNGVYG